MTDLSPAHKARVTRVLRSADSVDLAASALATHIRLGRLANEPEAIAAHALTQGYNTTALYLALTTKLEASA